MIVIHYARPTPRRWSVLTRRSAGWKIAWSTTFFTTNYVVFPGKRIKANTKNKMSWFRVKLVQTPSNRHYHSARTIFTMPILPLSFSKSVHIHDVSSFWLVSRKSFTFIIWCEPKKTVPIPRNNKTLSTTPKLLRKISFSARFVFVFLIKYLSQTANTPHGGTNCRIKLAQV